MYSIIKNRAGRLDCGTVLTTYKRGHFRESRRKSRQARTRSCIRAEAGSHDTDSSWEGIAFHWLLGDIGETPRVVNLRRRHLLPFLVYLPSCATSCRHAQVSITMGRISNLP